MWYVFPQIKGLGHSDMAQYYAISCVPEAVEYLEHPVLGSRYVEMLEAVMACLAASGSADLWSCLKAVLGGTDAKKFRSSVTLFSQAANLAKGPNAVACIGLTQKLFGLGLTSCSSTIALVQQPSCCDGTPPSGA